MLLFFALFLFYVEGHTAQLVLMAEGMYCATIRCALAQSIVVVFPSMAWFHATRYPGRRCWLGDDHQVMLLYSVALLAEAIRASNGH